MVVALVIVALVSTALTMPLFDYHCTACAADFERLVRASCARPEPRLTFVETRDDRSTLRSLLAILEPLKDSVPEATKHHAAVLQLLGQCDAAGRLPESLRLMASMALGALEQAIA